MDRDDTLKPKKPTGPMIGVSFAGWSIPELEAYLDTLEVERKRTDDEITARKLARDVAENFFKG